MKITSEAIPPTYCHRAPPSVTRISSTRVWKFHPTSPGELLNFIRSQPSIDQTICGYRKRVDDQRVATGSGSVNSDKDP